MRAAVIAGVILAAGCSFVLDERDGTGADVDIEPSTVDFGPIAVDAETARFEILVTARADDVDVNATLEAEEFQIRDDLCGDRLAAGDACTVHVSFTADRVGARSADLLLGDSVISLRAAGIPSTSLQFAQESIEFGRLEPPNVDSRSIVLRNEDVVGRQLEFEVNGDNDAFAVDGSDCGVQISANNMCEVEVSFTPSENEAFLATVIARGEGAPVAVLSVSGSSRIDLPEPE